MSSSDTSEKSVERKPEVKNSCQKSLEFSVFLMDYSEIRLSFEDQTRRLTANQVLNKVLDQLNALQFEHRLDFDSKYKTLFSIWITSPHLELQLQPTHRPFNILSKWDSLLIKHGPPEMLTDPTFIEKDQPTLSFQRNVFCDQSLETEIDDKDIGALYLLYFEAKLNVLDGRYPANESADFEYLAALQTAIDFGLKDKTNYNIDYFKQNLRKCIPFNYFKASDGNKFNGLIRTLSRNTKINGLAPKIYNKYEEISSQKLSEYKLLRTYLQKCWEIPCYGSAYFSAQIERPVKSKISLVSHFDLEIWVAINQTGIHLISKEKPELLVSIDHIDLCWAVGCPEPNSDPDCIPCIYIRIPNQNEDQNDDQILQIFSRQYQLIESLLNSFIKAAKITFNSNSIQTNRPSYDVTDGPRTVTDGPRTVTDGPRTVTDGPRTVTDGPIPPPRIVQPLHSVSSVSQQSKIYKPERLSLAKFNSKGEVVNKTGSWARVLKEQN